MSIKIDVQNFNFFYDTFHALIDLTFAIRENKMPARRDGGGR